MSSSGLDFDKRAYIKNAFDLLTTQIDDSKEFTSPKDLAELKSTLKNVSATLVEFKRGGKSNPVLSGVHDELAHRVRTAERKIMSAEDEKKLAGFKAKHAVISAAFAAEVKLTSELEVKLKDKPASVTDVLVSDDIMGKEKFLAELGIPEAQFKAITSLFDEATEAAKTVFRAQFGEEADTIRLHDAMITSLEKSLLKDSKQDSSVNWHSAMQILGKLSNVMTNLHPEFFDECIKQLKAAIHRITLVLDSQKKRIKLTAHEIAEPHQWLLQLESCLVELYTLMRRPEESYHLAKNLLQHLKKAPLNANKWIGENSSSIENCAKGQFNVYIKHLQMRYSLLCKMHGTEEETKAINQQIIDVIMRDRASHSTRVFDEKLTDVEMSILKKCRARQTGVIEKVVVSDDHGFSAIDKESLGALYTKLQESVLKESLNYSMFYTWVSTTMLKSLALLKNPSATKEAFETSLGELVLGIEQTNKFIKRSAAIKILNRDQLSELYGALGEMMWHKQLHEAALRKFVAAKSKEQKAVLPESKSIPSPARDAPKPLTVEGADPASRSIWTPVVSAGQGAGSLLTQQLGLTQRRS